MNIKIDKTEIWKAKDELTKRKTYSTRMQFGFEEGIKFALNQVNKLDITHTLIAWEQYKKANWYESESIDVEKMLMEQFKGIYCTYLKI
tara:strand:- start:202 stop:468 length:267 start_codon:yes stop_codon:yes gene_type:complete